MGFLYNTSKSIPRVGFLNFLILRSFILLRNRLRGLQVRRVGLRNGRIFFRKFSFALFPRGSVGWSTFVLTAYYG